MRAMDHAKSKQGKKSTTKSEKPSLDSCARLQVDSECTILANYCIPNLCSGQCVAFSVLYLLIPARPAVYCPDWLFIVKNACNPLSHSPPL